MLLGVAAHQHAVCRFPASVFREDAPSGVGGCPTVMLADLEIRELLQHLQVKLMQVQSLGREPVAVGVVLEQGSSVDTNGLLVQRDGPIRLNTVGGGAGGGGNGEEPALVHFPAQVRIE